MGILLKNVCFSYGDSQILNNIEMRVETGERIGVVGVSGGGKSTLLKILSGLYAPESGIVRVEGESAPEEIRKQVSIVMQNAALFPASIRENITCGHEMSETVIKDACHAAQIGEWISSLPEGLDTFVGERGGRVSGGQSQRIAIARAIAKNAPVVLLDEATSALDKETSEAVLLAINNLTQGKTVISVAHRPEALTGCGRIYRLMEGCLYEI